MEPTFNFWDTMAKRYPHFNDASMSKDVQTILSWAEQKGVVYKNASVLDIGSGTGTFSIPLALLGAHVTAIDPSSKMLEILHEDALNVGVSSITTSQSDWNAFEVTEPYDIVIASMTPAIHDTPTITKMINASKKYGIYVTWGKYRINSVVNALLKAHHTVESSSGLGSIEEFKACLQMRSFSFEYETFETAWSDTYTYEQAKEYAYEQLERRRITPDEASVEEVLKSYLHEDTITVETRAEKAMIVWSVAS